jgi:Tfp pilus assembly protein PilF
MHERFSALPRRQRLITLAGFGALVFILAVIGAVWALTGRAEERYRAGDEVAGLTAALDRGVPSDAPRVEFTDATEQAGIRFRHFPGRRATRLPEDMGSGAAWGDYDADGWLDLYLVNQAGPLDLTPAEVAASPGHAMLYHNLGDGTFEERSRAAGVDFRGTGMGAAWGDYDSDGHPDLLVTAYDTLVLYRNLGDGSFRDVTGPAGLGALKGFWTGVAWADYDRDGDLDAYVTGYVRYDDELGTGSSGQYDIEQPARLNPSTFPPERNLLLRNNGNGTFSEVASQAGVADPAGRGLAAAWADFDEDGWLDIYVANDISDNRLFRNRGNGTFEDVSHRALVADYRGSMGIAVGDWDGDSDFDLFLTHWIAQENALYTNQRRRPPERGGPDSPPDAPIRFMDEADRFGLGQVALDFIGWGTAFFDYDNDARPDLFVVNGSTFQRKDDPTRLVPMRDQLFWNGGGRRGFYDVSFLAGPYFRQTLVGRGLAVADYDNDGDLDAIIVNHGDHAVLLRNDATATNAWVQMWLEGRESNRSAVGARVRIVAGQTGQVQAVGSQPSYLSQHGPVLHFGLGTATTVDTVEVRWPAGGVQVFTDLPVRTRVRLVEGGAPVADGTPAADQAHSMADAGISERDRVRSFWRHYREATALRVGGRLEAAIAAYRRAHDLDPDHEDTLYYLGSTLLDLAAYEEAQTRLERLVELNPRSARGHARLGVLHMCRPAGSANDRLRDAEQAFHNAAAVNREETGNHLRLAEVAVVRRDTAAVTRALERVLGSNPGSGPAHFLRGFLAWEDGRERVALDAFRKALSVGDGPGDGLASGEGDTRTPPSGASRVAPPCPPLDLIESELTRDRGTPPDRLPAVMQRRYQAFARRLAALRLDGV